MPATAVSAAPRFSHLGDESVLGGLTTVRLRAKEAVYHQGDSVEHFHLIRTGLLGMYRLIYPDKQIMGAKIGQGEPVGLTHLHLGTPYPAMVVPLKETVAYRGDREDLERLSHQHGEWINELLLRENETQSHLFEKLEDVIARELDERIAEELLDLADRVGRRTDEGIEIIVRLSRKGISRMVGCAQESVSRILSEWEKNGWIRTNHKRITLRHPDALRSLITSGA